MKNISYLILFLLFVGIVGGKAQQPKSDKIALIRKKIDHYTNDYPADLDSVTRRKWEKKGIELGDAECMFLYAEDIHDKNEKWKYLSMAANLGYSQAMVQLSLLYSGYQPNKSHVNCDSAMYWLKKSINSEPNYYYSNKYMGDYYYWGVGVKQDYNVALNYYELACGALEVDCDSVVNMYRRGLVPKDTVEYKRWSEKLNAIEHPDIIR